MPSVDDDDEVLLLSLLYSLHLANDIAERTDAYIREQRRQSRRLPKRKNRPTWRSFVHRVSADHFRRMFRMPIASFDKLCQDICNTMSEEVFCPA